MLKGTIIRVESTSRQLQKLEAMNARSTIRHATEFKRGTQVIPLGQVKILRKHQTLTQHFFPPNNTNQPWEII